MIERILVALDGSASSKKAADFASELARATQAHLILLSVLEQPVIVPFGPLDSFALARRESDRQLAAVREMLDSIPHQLPPERVEKVIEYGVPADVIVEQANTLRANLIVMGSRGHSPAQHILLGSVSDRVVHHASVPVTVVR